MKNKFKDKKDKNNINFFVNDNPTKDQLVCYKKRLKKIKIFETVVRLLIVVVTAFFAYLTIKLSMSDETMMKTIIMGISTLLVFLSGVYFLIDNKNISIEKPELEKAINNALEIQRFEQFGEEWKTRLKERNIRENKINQEKEFDDQYLQFCEQIIGYDNHVEADPLLKEESPCLNSQELDSLKKAFVRTCVNEYPVFDELKKTDYDTGTYLHLDNRDKDDWLMVYRRKDLARLAKEAFDRKEEYFYCEPEDANNPYGNLVSCEPKYGYDLKRTLTEKEYDFLFRRAQ